MKNHAIVAGNWKMHKSPTEGRDFIEDFMNLMLNVEDVEVIFCPPFSALFNIDVVLRETPYKLGAQNCHWENEGAFTGEVSVSMLKNCGVDYVILGHSERRHVFNETNEWINNKMKAVCNGGLKPILCIGETLDQRKSNETKDVLYNQLKEGLIGVEDLGDVVIAYEPVWAIGTGETATLEQVSEAHKWVRDILSDFYSQNIANDTSILYGGSVKPANAGELFEIKDVNGFLIGGASLKIDPFKEIILTVNEKLKG
ncbi:MAG: triose-phosphate isomerase [Candidatus Marinimicrobia bacterium]|nr:triose-phosphate isomerase [Candidatus Neomarinimicrobiota bacterium]